MSSRAKIPEHLSLGKGKPWSVELCRLLPSGDITLQAFSVTSWQIFWIVNLEAM